MTSGNITSGGRPPKVRGPDGRPISSLPSVKARVLAFGSILVAGICGALIGNSIVALGCHGSGCTTNEGIGTVVGGVIAAVGVAVVAVLVLRAMGEWRTIKEERALEEAADAAAAGAQAAARLGTRPAENPPDRTAPGVGPEAVEPEGRDASPTE